MGYQYITIAEGSGSGAGDGPLIQIDLATAIQIALGNLSAIQSVFNQTVLQAEANLPEGSLVEAELTGFNIPVVGSVGDTIANHLNQQYASGITDPENPSETLSGWPDYPNQIAWYDSSSDTLTLRWVKGQPWFIWLIGIILVAFGIYYIVQLVMPGWFGSGSYTYRLMHAIPVSTTTQQQTGLSPLTKVLIGAAVSAVAVGVIWYEAELHLREAGANKSYQEIVIER